MEAIGAVLGSAAFVALLKIVYDVWVSHKWQRRASELADLRAKVSGDGEGDREARDLLTRRISEIVRRGLRDDEYEDGLDIDTRINRTMALVGALGLIASLTFLVAYGAYCVSVASIGEIASLFVVFAALSFALALAGTGQLAVRKARRKKGSGRTSAHAADGDADRGGASDSPKEPSRSLAGERAGNAPDPGEQGEKVDGGGE